VLEIENAGCGIVVTIPLANSRPPSALARARRGKRTIMIKPGFDAEFDVVVVGAGSAGCVLSARLTENPGITLCAI
jgi:hypothetical protein